MITIEQERPLIEIDVGREIEAVAFIANGEYIVCGGDALGVWRVEDGKQVAAMAARDVLCLTVSRDGRWIAAGTNYGHVFVWDAKTSQEIFTHREDRHAIHGVDFSPDSTRLVTASKNGTVTVWDIAAAHVERVLTLNHEDCVIAAKYSPHGDRIATAGARDHSVRVWDSTNGRLLVDIPAGVNPWLNTGLLWSNNHLFVISDNKMKQFEASTGSAVSEWPVHDTNNSSCIALPRHAEFIAYSTNDTITFWNTSTHAQLDLIQHSQNIYSIALTPDNRFLAIGGLGGKITIRSLSRITVSILLLWIIPDMNNFLVPLVFPNRIQFHGLVYIPLSRNLTFRSTTLRCIHGSTINSRTRTRY